MATDPLDVIEKVAFEKLDVPAVTSLAKVHQHVPENAPAPLIIIGDLTSEPIQTKAATGDATVRLVIAAASPAKERRPLRAIKAAVLAALDGLTLVRDGRQVQFAFSGDDGLFDAESESYGANFEFTVLAFATA